MNRTVSSVNGRAPSLNSPTAPTRRDEQCLTSKEALKEVKRKNPTYFVLNQLPGYVRESGELSSAFVNYVNFSSYQRSSLFRPLFKPAGRHVYHCLL